MSDKIKKRSSDLSFGLSRWFRRIQATPHTTLILTILGIGYTVFLFGGGLYTLITHPLPAYLGTSTIYFLYPSISGQFVSDTIIACILYAFGFVGLLAIYQSTKSAYKPRQAYMLLIIGVTFLFLSYIFLEGSIAFKNSGGA
ncbi:MAG: hypothetical protein ABSG33_08650 [Candidatus Bathyarchaeia archaeon]|jgi:hypothetical protein